MRTLCLLVTVVQGRERIVGGNTTADGEIPWQCSILRGEDRCRVIAIIIVIIIIPRPKPAYGRQGLAGVLFRASGSSGGESDHFSRQTDRQTDRQTLHHNISINKFIHIITITWQYSILLRR